MIGYRIKTGLDIFAALLTVSVSNQMAVEHRFFSKNLYPIFQKANCSGCHVDNGIASATRLHFPSDSASPEQIEAFGKGLVSLVNRDSPEQSLLLQKPTNRIKHTGGERIAPGSEEEKALIAWVNYLAGFSTQQVVKATERVDIDSEPTPQPVLMRRLTHNQYNNTVRDLLGDQTRPAHQFPQEDFFHGFKNQAEAQSIPPLLAESYSAAAEKLAQNAFRGGDVNRLIPCRPSSARDVVCSSKFIRHFGLRAFRRPLTETEFRRYADLFAKEAKRTGQFLRGAQLMVEAMLQSPNFLFRMERGSEGQWEQYETAARLSYFLWGTMPDDMLFRSAEHGELATSEGIERLAWRMLRDPRARQALDEFVSQWLRFDRVLNTVKDRRLYPQFSPELAAAMTEETKRLVGHLVWKNRNFMEIYAADYSFLNSDLAAIYKLPSPPEEFGMVRFPATSERAGILGEATFLTLTSKPEETSPTERGLFIREHFLCQKVPSPPPGVNATLPPLTESKPQTNRQRLQVHLATESCASCHRLIDPIGFGFEKFDAIGQWCEKLPITFFPDRTDRNKKKPTTVELELDTRAVIHGIPDSEFSSPKELGGILARNPECQKCVVKQLFRYALGRPEALADRPTIENAFVKFRDSQFRFQELIISLVKSDSFRAGAR